MRLDHATLRTSELEATRAFFETVLDLRVGYRPDFSFPGYWLYAGDAPLVHLIPGPPIAVDRARESIDHVAFLLRGYDRFRDRLAGCGLAFSTMELPELGERRLFVRTPTQILLELVFRDAEEPKHDA